MICSSCDFQSNKLCFDKKKQTVRSSNFKGIRMLYIEQDSTEESCIFIWRGDEENVPKSVDFTSINSGYEIFDSFLPNIVVDGHIRLSPFTKYRIERVQGDVGSYRFYVWTDINGKIVKVDPKYSCD